MSTSANRRLDSGRVIHSGKYSRSGEITVEFKVRATDSEQFPYIRNEHGYRPSGELVCINRAVADAVIVTYPCDVPVTLSEPHLRQLLFESFPDVSPDMYTVEALYGGESFVVTVREWTPRLHDGFLIALLCGDDHATYNYEGKKLEIEADSVTIGGM